MLVHGLSLEAAESLTTEDVVRLLPVPVLEGLATEAEARGDEDVAGMLEAVAVVADRTADHEARPTRGRARTPVLRDRGSGREPRP